MTITSRFVLPSNLNIKCDECGFNTSDVILARNHDCEVQRHGGRCEDFPCCGHENGDCNGLLYGSDESIKEQVEIAWRTGHGDCDHADGIFNCVDFGDEDEDDDDVD